MQVERNKILQGDALTMLKTLPDGIVQTCVTSPHISYFGLRDYGTGQWAGGNDTCTHRVGNQVQDSKAPGAIIAGMRPGTDASTCKICGATRTDQQIGLEDTPEAYIARLVEVFREVKRVLRDDGTLWVNLGSSYVSGIIESEEYIMRDDLTEEETAYVYAELAKHFTRQSQALSEMQQAHASPEQDMQELLHRAEVTTRELRGEDL